MTKIHEFRDPIHVFIRVENSERKAIDSRPFQRLRHIHHLALTYLVYPGATHRRFEHSLGVMELAGRVYDTVTSPANIHNDIRDIIPLKDSHEHIYWRCALRMAALFHDVGHLPFSHASEDLLPSGWDHERLTYEIILSDELAPIWRYLKINPTDIAKLAIGSKFEKYKKNKSDSLTDWEAILSEIITGNAFGVDRIDYLLRDSHHAGVGYGKFDHYRLIDTLRILPKKMENSLEPSLGVEEGGLHSAEALLFARYFMFKQVYLHPIRRIYDFHLVDFLKKALPGGKFSTDINDHLTKTDNDILFEMIKAERDPAHPAHLSSDRILNRKHFRLLYERNPEDLTINPEPGKAIYIFFTEKFDAENVKHDLYVKGGGDLDFPVLEKDGRIVSSLAKSETLNKIPPARIDYVFINSDMLPEARKILNKERTNIISRMERE